MIKLTLVIVLITTAVICVAQQDVRQLATLEENALDSAVENAQNAVDHLTVAHQQLADDGGTQYKHLQFKIKVNAMEVRDVIKQFQGFLEDSKKVITKETINAAFFGSTASQSNIDELLLAVRMIDKNIRTVKKEIQVKSVNVDSTLKSLYDEVLKAGQEKVNRLLIEKSISEVEEAVVNHNALIEKMKNTLRSKGKTGNDWANQHYNEGWSFLCTFLSHYIPWFSCPKNYDEVVDENRKLLTVFEKHTEKKGELEAQLKERRLHLKKLKTNQLDLSTAETGLKLIISFLHQLNIILNDVHDIVSEMKLWLEKFSKSSDASKKLSDNDSFNKGVVHFSRQWRIIGAFAGKHSEALEEVNNKLQIIYKTDVSETGSSKKLTDEKRQDEL